jgi:hypothetical protein
MEGKKSYKLIRTIEMTQKLAEDRVYWFTSSCIIDDLTIHLKQCGKLNVFFSPTDKNSFMDIGADFGSKVLENRDVLLPGEKFKVFIYKK